jgi:hypothetical protein
VVAGGGSGGGGSFLDPSVLQPIALSGVNAGNGEVVIALQAAPGPIPGAGLLSYIALGLLGVGSIGWKRLRMRSV